jgi:beta-hydroxyacyl-ACP dehydratase FabZ
MIPSEKVAYKIEDILRILPHRFPFLLIDRVLSVVEGPNSDSRMGRKVVAIKNVTFNEPYFMGHFPHRPVMPGVLQIETMAQAGALAAFRETDPPQDVAIVSVSEAKFRRPIVPGDSLHVHAEITKDRGSMIGLICAVYVDGVKAAEAEMLAKVFPLKV